MKVEHVVQCQFHNWYEKFAKVTFKSYVVPTNEGFVSWLKNGEFNISSSAFPVKYHADIEEQLDPDNAFDMKECEDDKDNQSDVTKQEWYPSLKSQVEKIIKEELEGATFPKLNWSSPRDAVWVTFNNSLKCKTLEDILLLLKSSDFISSDLTQPFLHCETNNDNNNDNTEENNDNNIIDEKLNFYLILRKWYDNIVPSMEFRCYVSHNQIVGISQRSLIYYEFLDDVKDKIKRKIFDFYKKNIHNEFFTHTFSFDVYIDKRERVWLIDFNPFGRRTDSLLFSWDELFAVHLLIQQKYEKDPSHYSSLLEGDQSEFLEFKLADPSHSSSSILQNAIFGIPDEEISVSTPEGLERLIQLQQEQAALFDDDQ